MICGICVTKTLLFIAKTYNITLIYRKLQMSLTCFTTKLTNNTAIQTSRAMEPDQCCCGARTFQTVMKGNSKNHCFGSQLTTSIYMKIFPHICPT